LKLIKVLANVSQHRRDLTKDDILNKYGSLFSGLGLLKEDYNISLDEKVHPVIHPPRKVPLAIRYKLKILLK